MATELPPLKNDRLLRVARGEKVDRVPVWLMRQAGRYLPEFRELRRDYTYDEICRTPRLACEATMQPLRRYDVDGAVMFADMLALPRVMGLSAEMLTETGPHFPEPLDDPKDLRRLRDPDVSKELKYAFDAIAQVRRELQGRVPVIGFSGAPWTLMSYMIEGTGSKTMSKAKRWLYATPRESHELLGRLTNVIIEYMTNQVKYGAQFLYLFDTNVRVLDSRMFAEFVVPYIKRIREYVKDSLARENLPDVPMALFPMGAHYALDQVRDIGFEVVGVDWCIPPKAAREVLGPNITLQGNLDPCALYATTPRIAVHVKNMLADFGTDRYIANLGHGLYPDIEPTKVAVFVKTVHQESAKMIAHPAPH
ncbi:uroporphyrinogen decarboxylase-like [Ornithodoros turicata]|uniref:uroporphyrinogen decarboxylase-like n=1 Tax=Ornithodoros turicata TaxID=34597 RepID=UPI003139BEC7